MDLKIRLGESSDMESVLLLIKELALFEKESNMVELTVEDLIHDGFGESPCFKVFVAEYEGEIIGMALFYYRYSTWKGKTLHLEDLVVREAYRNKGIGNKLFSEVMKYAHDQKLKRVAWDVLDWNTVAVNYYKSTGAKVLDDWRVVHMDEKSLNEFVLR